MSKTSHLNRESVRLWWNERKRAGKALYYADVKGMFKPGHDYIGELPWPAYVSLDAFYRDYLMHRDARPIGRFSFAYHLRTVAGLRAGESRQKPALTEDGEKMWNKMCVYYDISQLAPPEAKQ